MSLKIHTKGQLTLKSKNSNVVIDAPGFLDAPELHLTTPLSQSYMDLSGLALTSDLSAYLTSSDAGTTYQTQAGMSDYLTSSNASSTYQTQAGMSDYLTSSNASSTYQTQSGMSDYLTSSNASSTYQTQAGMSDYLTSSNASSTYQPIGTYLVSSDLTGYVQSVSLQSEISGLSSIQSPEIRVVDGSGFVDKLTAGSCVVSDLTVGDVWAVNINSYEYHAIEALVSVKTNEGKFNTYKLICTGKRTAAGSAEISTDTQIQVVNEEDALIDGVSAVVDGNSLKIQFVGKSGATCSVFARVHDSIMKFN
jgi:hypothetical protein